MIARNVFGHLSYVIFANLLFSGSALTNLKGEKLRRSKVIDIEFWC